MADTVSQTVLFPDLFDKPLVATFDQQHASSDGGAVLLKAAERQYGLIDGFAECLVDDRQPGKVRHTLADLRGQRIFGIACGHPDGNDGDRLADDPLHKLLLGRDPITGDALASQPTISRFENDVGSQELYAMGQELAMSVIERHQRRRRGHARRVTIDLDPTDDATHGAQQLTFFNKYYDRWCYLPLKRPRFSWTRIKGESNVQGGGGNGSVEGRSTGRGIGADGGSPEGDWSPCRRGGGRGGRPGAGVAVERQPEARRGAAAAAWRIAGGAVP